MTVKKWFTSGSPWVWLSASAVTASLIMVVGLLVLIAVRGMAYFWPADVYQFEYREGNNTVSTVIGEIYDSEIVSAARIKDGGYSLPSDYHSQEVERYLIKTGNRDVVGLDFRLIVKPNIVSTQTPKDIMVLERREWGNYYGFLDSVKENGKVVVTGDNAMDELEARLDRALQLYDEIHHIETKEIGAINYGLEKLRLKQRAYELDNDLTPEQQAELDAERAELNKQYNDLIGNLENLYKEIGRDSIMATSMGGAVSEIHLSKIVRSFQPNKLSGFGKLALYLEKVWEFISDEPREANTEGGVFPAIFGTVLMVILMAVVVTPFGVLAAVYLREYAKQGLVTRLIRISVINLAGVPSIVYGVFGLGFFVYFLGANIDTLFYPEAFPAPTFGTPGIIWASLTLAILTVPVVIVSTEEGLSRIPRAIREGSLALGSTKAETLWRVVIPMSSPAIMTGLILAVARAAGEVAPLMLVGVVKLAPSLPLDGNFPFLHLERKFMHLGFHIYDVGFQSPNVEAARPLVYATALLLVLVIIGLNLAAISIRNHLREKYRALEN